MKKSIILLFVLICNQLLSQEIDSLSDYNEKIKDSLTILVKNSKNEIYRLEAKFKNTESQIKIKQLKIQNDKVRLLEQNNNLKYIIVATISFKLLLLIFFILYFVKNKNKLAKASELKNIQQIALLRKQKEVEVMQALIDGEESERIRIARDLHDGIGSRLSSLKMQLNQMQFAVNQEENLKAISNSLSISINELRHTAFNLVPETLLKLGLELALKDLCYSMNNNNVSIEFSPNEIQDSILETNQISIFRIVQETINNSLKHSNCSEIIVDCSQNGNLFLITVEDNGIGFNTNEMENFKGLGLKNINNRVELLNGNLDIKSTINNGTIINIELQIQTKK